MPALEVEGLAWGNFLTYFDQEWSPGEHVAIIAPTGAGKTTFAAGILDLRQYVLALDPKGGDPTLAALHYRRLASWPSRSQMERLLNEDEEKGRASRFVVGPVVQKRAELAKLRDVQEKALEGAFDQGGWTIYVDELQVLTDARLMALATGTEELLIAARSKAISVVSSYQAPRRVPRAAADQATYMAVAYTRDVDVVNRLSEMMGRPRAELRGAIRALPQYVWMIGSRNPRDPLIVTQPNKVAAAPLASRR